MKIDDLADKLSDSEQATGAKMFMNRPDRWYEKATWGCNNGHVSRCYLKSETKGSDLCLACGERVRLIPPEFQTDEQLQIALKS